MRGTCLAQAGRIAMKRFAGLPDHFPASAVFAQIAKLFLQFSQFPDTVGHVADVFIQKRVDFMAVVFLCVIETQKCPDFIERHVQCPAAADEEQAFHVLRAVYPVIAVCPAAVRQKAFPLVIADGFHLRAGFLCQFADFHAVLPEIDLCLFFYSILLDSIAATGFLIVPG